ncbi:response regulator [Sphingomonas sp. GB1N7]|uniref:response regulator n=1 Tax=Parasphingomonas caseinilytica TaxID=3096158 RepID=UPI002FC953AA
MAQKKSSAVRPLRVFCLEDNPLIVFHLEQMIEDLGHIFAGSLDSFIELQRQASSYDMDCALVDIDLADGPTGPSAMAWLLDRAIPAVFVTGQAEIAADFADISVGTVGKPISRDTLAAALLKLREALS